MTDDDQYNPARSAMTEQQWRIQREDAEKAKAKPAEPLKWNPFKELLRGPGRSARANDVLHESIRRSEADLQAGPEEMQRQWNDQLREMLDSSGDRGRLPDNFFSRGTDDDTDGDAA